MLRMRLLLTAFTIVFFFKIEKSTACGYNYISSCATLLELEVDGQDRFFYAENCTYANNFHNYNFGTVNELSFFKITTRTWESCSNKVLNAKLFYRIYAQGATPGIFQSINLPMTSLGGVGSYRDRTFEAEPNLDILGALTPGTNYNFEVYFASDIDFNDDNISDAMLSRNNGGVFYKATFKKTGGGSGMNITFTSKTNVSCSGGSDGRLTALATGGPSPFSYAWSNGMQGSTIQNLAAGTYTVTATASNSATASASATIVQPQPLNPQFTIVNETAPNARNGSISCTVTGGTAPYNFQWNNGSTNANINGLGAGAYTVTVGDSKGCSAVRTVSLIVEGSVPGGYCGSNGLIPWNDWVSEVSLSTFTNASDKSSYTNFTNLPGPTLTAGEPYSISVKSANGWFPNPEFYRVWIDFNRNGIFENSEQVLDKNVVPPPAGLNQLAVNQIFTVPATAGAGVTRMRISMKRGGNPLACEAIQYGEVEDYHLTLQAPAGSCPMTTAVSSIQCNNNGTANTPDDDRFTFSLLVGGSGSGWSAIVNGATVTGSYGVARTFGPYNISAGVLSFTVKDNTNQSCQKNVIVTPPAPCSNAPCTLTANVSNIQCDNSGTTNTGADDRFTFSLLVTGTSTGTGWSANVGGTLVTGAYGTAKLLGPFNISGGNLNFTVADAQNASCNDQVTVPAPAPCSVSGGPTNYCQSKSDFPWHEWISKVTFESINKTSGKWTYTDFTGYNASVVRGSSYPVSLFASFSWDARPEYFKVWIDYNRDGAFAEPSEIAFQGILSGVSNGSQDAPLNGTIAIPATATTGVTRMRVSMKRGAYPTPCEALIPFGEVEDYSVTINNSLLGGAENRENWVQIHAEKQGLGSHVEAELRTTAAIENLRLERADEYQNWQTIHEWTGIWLPENERIEFDFEDKNAPKETHFYRLTAGLHDARVLFSNIEKVENQRVDEFLIFPNPARGGEVFINLETLLGQDVALTVVHPIGKIVFENKIENLQTPLLPLPTEQFANGEYFILVQSPGRRLVSRKLVVVKE